MPWTQQLSRGCSPSPAPVQDRLGFSASPGRCRSPYSQAVTPLLLGMWPSLAFPAHKKARARLHLPPQPGPAPGGRIPPSTHGTFSLSPCPLLTAYPGRTLGSSATGWYRCRLLPACCQHCLSSSLASSFPTHLSQQSHASQALSRAWDSTSHGTHHCWCPQPFPSSACVLLHSVPGLTLHSPKPPLFLAIPTSPRL